MTLRQPVEQGVIREALEKNAELQSELNAMCDKLAEAIGGIPDVPRIDRMDVVLNDGGTALRWEREEGT